MLTFSAAIANVANDKETALSLVRDYLSQIEEPEGTLGKIAHLYRKVIISDIRQQIEAHIAEDSRLVVDRLKRPIRFRQHSKTVDAENGVLSLNDSVRPAEIRRYAFAGLQKTIFDHVGFDSVPEKDFAALLERDKTVLKWVRPPNGQTPISHAGRQYNPDFFVETKTTKYVIEVKGTRDLSPEIDGDVRSKAKAAIAWCEHASKKDEKQWEYRLVPEDAIGPSADLRFVLGQAVVV